MKIGQTSAVGFLSQFASSIIGFLVTIYITRSLGAAVFGEYMLVISVVLWLQVVGVFGVQSATTKRLSEEGESEAYFAAGGVMILTAFLILTAFVLLFADQINGYIGQPVAVFIPLLLLGGMLFKYVSAALRGVHKVHVASLLHPVDRTVRSILQILVVFLSFGLLGLLVSYAVAAVVTAVLGLYFLSLGFERPNRDHVRRITSFAQYAWLGKVGSRMFSSMDTIVLGFFVSSSLIGNYEVAWNLASVLAIFGVAIAQALFPEMSYVASKGDPAKVGDLVTKGLAYSGLFLVPGLVGSLLIGDLLLQLYGNEFQQSMRVLSILVFARLIYEYGNQFTNGLNGIDRPDLSFRVNAVFVVSNVGLNVLLIATYGWIGAAVATTISALISSSLAYRSFNRLVPIAVPFAEIGKQWFSAIVMGGVVYASRLVLPERALVGILLVGIGAAIYTLVLVVISSDFRETIRRNVPLPV